MVLHKSSSADEGAATPRLADRTSLGVGGRPEQYYEPSSEAEASVLLARLARERIPVRILGGGCNLLPRDDVLPGAVVSSKQLRAFAVYGDRVVVGAGASFPSLVRRSIELRIPGLPGCPGIPGSVGGVVFMNAGGRFGTVSDALIAVRGLSLRGRPFEHPVHVGDFGYRRNSLGPCFVTAAVFRRDPSLDPDMLQGLFDEAMAWKRQTQPLSSASAGCMFKNPDGPTGPRSAGRLIDDAGCKGLRVGDAMVSPQHANFIVNTGQATAGDVHALIAEVKRRVWEACRVRLELEVQVW